MITHSHPHPHTWFHFRLQFLPLSQFSFLLLRFFSSRTVFFHFLCFGSFLIRFRFLLLFRYQWSTALLISSQFIFMTLRVSECVLMIRSSTNTQVDECNAKYHINLHHYFVRSCNLVHNRCSVRWVTLFMSFFLTLSHHTHTHTEHNRWNESFLHFFLWYRNNLIGSAAVAVVPSTCKKKDEWMER